MGRQSELVAAMQAQAKTRASLTSSSMAFAAIVWRSASREFSLGLRLELSRKHNIRVTCIQPGAVESELFEHISDASHREQMEKLKEEMTFLKAEDVADTIVFALQSPPHVDLAELFIMPTQQPW